MTKNKFKHKIKISYNSAQYADLMRGRKLMTSSLLPDLEDMISGPSLVRKLSLLRLRYLEEHAARTKKNVTPTTKETRTCCPGATFTSRCLAIVYSLRQSVARLPAQL